MFSLSSCIHELPFSALVAFFCNPKLPVKRACVFTLLKWSQSKCRTLPRWCSAGEGRVTLSEVRACCCHCVGLCRWRFSLKCKCVVVLSVALAFICAVISERNGYPSDFNSLLSLHMFVHRHSETAVRLYIGAKEEASETNVRGNNEFNSL